RIRPAQDDGLDLQVVARADPAHNRRESARCDRARLAGDTESPSATAANPAATGLAAAATENLFPRPTARNPAANAGPSPSRRESAKACRHRAKTVSQKSSRAAGRTTRA